MTPLGDAVAAALIQSLWQDAAVAVACFAVLIALRRRSANARYAASCAALALMVALPVMTAAEWYVTSRHADGSPVLAAARAGALVSAAMPTPAGWFDHD